MPKSVLWNRDEQTECKHKVLECYLDGWFPILGTQAKRLLFVDGFSGPGEYDGGEPGSPIVALDSVKRHKDAGRLKDVEIDFVFVEKDSDRAQHLRRLVSGYPCLPDTRRTVLNGEFDSRVTDILNDFEKRNRLLDPSFFMIDPFGVKGNRIDILGRILKNRRSELFISFMYEPIRRFKQQPEFEKPLTDLFGTEEWKRVLDMGETGESKRFLHSLFSKQLKRHGAKFVVPFEIWKRGRHVYTMYFCTGHPKGCNLMKESIWKVDPRGTFELRAHTDQRLDLFDPDMMALGRELRKQFGDQSTPMTRVEQFVMSDQTVFHLGQLRSVLQRMLDDDLLEKSPSHVRQFPAERVSVRFLDGSERRPRSSHVGGGRSLFDRTNP